MHGKEGEEKEMKDWTKFEKVACSVIILFGLVVGWGICSLGQSVIDAKTQYYALKLEQGR